MKKNETYEGAITRLEKIVAGLEQGELPLEDSLKLFEEGVALSNFCNAKLKNAEQKITQLSDIPERPEEN